MPRSRVRGSTAKPQSLARPGSIQTGSREASLLYEKEKPHISRRGASGTGGGAFRWPSGSTLVRIDGPPSLRAVHSPSLTGGPASSDSTDSLDRLQHRRRAASAAPTERLRTTSPWGPPDAACQGGSGLDEDDHRAVDEHVLGTASSTDERRIEGMTATTGPPDASSRVARHDCVSRHVACRHRTGTNH